MSENILRLRSSADVVAAIPYLLGFHPSESVVVLGSGGSDGTFVIRLELTAGDDLIRHIAGVVAQRAAPEIILVGYGRGEQVTPVIDKVRKRLAGHGVDTCEELRVHEGRYWSYLCRDPTCCPPEGKAVATASPVAAQATLGGLVAFPDRHELERSIEPIDAEAMRTATARAERRLAALAANAEGHEAVRSRMAREGLPLVRTLVERACADGDPPSDDEVAWLGVLLTCLRVRDEAWVRIDDAHLGAHIALWRDVLRRVAPSYAAGPACLLAFAAWRSGDGALANIALDRALAADPDYTMALLLHELLASGIPPWSVPLTMTPDQLEEV